jgi:hypothetical protein
MKKTLYFTDWEYSNEAIEKEMMDINNELEDNGVNDCMVTEFTQLPPFVGHSEEKYYDVMYFDFGGVMTVCYSTVSNFIECILKESKEYPNRYYVVTSTFSLLLEEFETIVNDFFGGEKPFNVFYSIKEFCDFYKKYEK